MWLKLDVLSYFIYLSTTLTKEKRLMIFINDEIDNNLSDFEGVIRSYKFIISFLLYVVKIYN